MITLEGKLKERGVRSQEALQQYSNAFMALAIEAGFYGKNSNKYMVRGPLNRKRFGPIISKDNAITAATGYLTLVQREPALAGPLGTVSELDRFDIALTVGKLAEELRIVTRASEVRSLAAGYATGPAPVPTPAEA